MKLCPSFAAALFVIALSGVLSDSPVKAADDKDSDVESDFQKEQAAIRKEKFTKWMQEYAKATKVQLLAEGEPRPAELVPNPVFRYSDEERAIPDATLWVWTIEGRPAAFQKVEGNNHGGGRQWTICFASLSEGRITVQWPFNRKYEATKAGVTFAGIPGAEAPSDKPRIRSQQIKTLKDRFTGRLGTNDQGEGGSETRIIAKPIFEYADAETKLPRGAIFGMSATGTNPDMLLLIEARPDDKGQPRWEFAYARMTSNSVLLRLDNEIVWWQDAVPLNRSFDNWGFYFLPREFK